MIFISNSINAQDNLEVGSNWIYTMQCGGYSFKPKTVEIISDTIINNLQWFKPTGIDQCANSFSEVFIRETESKFYYYDIETSQENLLYDFDKLPGESWTVKIPGSGIVYHIGVDSIGLINLNDTQIQIQYIDNINVGLYLIRGIGSNKFLFPQGNICDPQFIDIRCFTNDNTSLDFDEEHACDEVIDISSSIEKYLPSILVYPNPANDFIHINNVNDHDSFFIKIFDFKGNEMKIQNKSETENILSIDLSKLPKGIYFVSISNAKYFFSKKIIKQ